MRPVLIHPRGFDLEAARRALARRDPRLAAAMRRIGPLDVGTRWSEPFDTVDVLARAILYQQLSGKAAATIVGRVERAIGAERLHVDTLARIDDERLRACGVSAAKARALRDLCARAEGGEVPDARRLARMDSEAIVEQLSAVRGIGRWTVEMLLIFRLGRPDVLPLDDLGIRRGTQWLDGLDAAPGRRELAERGEAWAPWRSLAALYLWRIADGG
ncbi:DNA-3-methyladenine glycosylase family protein [Aquimonas voraii]|uniref:DNA-3-methyladenine glycosylase II n=1 Tax=Aquimonas voraii TaxID=265719 RepID=A0A1G6ZZ41_9GAMM|nr:DNA-3-methyladenine glycosylase 2 family protein [Aquimonas voraii]SDE07780.1 DNA-3-methyladenine glycosylase II [Aquimonas voraii]